MLTNIVRSLERLVGFQKNVGRAAFNKANKTESSIVRQEFDRK